MFNMTALQTVCYPLLKRPVTYVGMVWYNQFIEIFFLKDSHVEHVRNDDIAQWYLSQESRPEGRLLQEVLQQVQNALQRQRVEHDGGEQADVEGVVGVIDVEKDDVAPQLSREV